MPVSVTFNGTVHSIPTNRQARGWGAALSSFLQDVGNNALAKSGGSFILTADVNFGSNYGVVSKYFKSVTSNIAQSGAVRLARADVIAWRNQANGADLELSVNSSNVLLWAGNPITTLALGAADTVLKMNAGGTAYEYGKIANANVDASAAIAYSKLALTGGIVDADVNASAAISWSKISKSGSNLTDLATRSHTSLSDIGTNSHATIDSHIASTSNPHSVTASQVGLGNVDNTSDATKNSATATLTNKTVGDPLTFTEVSTPSTPSAGLVKLYPKSDGNFYKIDDTGVEVAVGSGAGGSGEKNYIENPSGESSTTGWSNVGDLDIARTTTAADLPREYTTGSGLKITADSNTQSTADYVYYDFTLDDVDLNKKLKIQWSQKTTGTYNAGDLAVVITTQADRTTALHTPVTTAIPASDGVFITSFDSGSTATLSLVIRATTDMTTDGGIVISDVIVGPGVITQGAVVESWQSYTPTLNSDTNVTTKTGKWRRVGQEMEFEVSVLYGGAGHASTFTFTLPSGYSLDTSLGGWTNGRTALGSVMWFDDGVSYKTGDIIYNNVTSSPVSLTIANDGAGSQLSSSSFGSNDRLYIRGSVPIAEWAGSGTVNLAQNDVEFLSNSSTGASSDTTSFAYGPAGSRLPNGAAAGTFYKRVRRTTPKQAGDLTLVELSLDGGVTWTPAGHGGITSGSTVLAALDFATDVGFGFVKEVSSTDIDVGFLRYRSGTGDWSSISTTSTLWRVRIVSAGQAVGFGRSQPSSLGLVSSYAPSVRSNTLATSSNYTITETDGYEHFDITTGASVITVTLPAASVSAGRRISIKKVDSGNGRLSIARAGSDTIEGLTSYTHKLQWEGSTLYSDGTGWRFESSHQQTIDTTYTATFNGSGGTSAAQDIYITRSGSVVTVRMSPATATTGTSSTTFTTTAVIPTWARPSHDTILPWVGVRLGSGPVLQATPGAVSVTSSGTLVFIRDYTSTAWPNSTASCGMNTTISLSWSIL